MPRDRRRRRTLPRDVRTSLGVAAAAMGLIGVAGVVVGYVLAVRGETIPAFVGMVVGQVLTGLTLMGRWVLSYQAGEPGFESEEVPGKR